MASSINTSTQVPVGAPTFVSELAGTIASSVGASAAPLKGEGRAGLQNQQGNAKFNLYKKIKGIPLKKKIKMPSLTLERTLRRQQDKETSVPLQLDSGVSNKEEFTFSTTEEVASVFDNWESVPAEQKKDAEKKFDELKTSMDACKSDGERQTVLQNAVVSMQELVSQMPAASQAGMREKLSNLFGRTKNVTVKGDKEPITTSNVDGDKEPITTSDVDGDEKPVTTSNVDGDKEPVTIFGGDGDKKPGTTSKSGGNEGPEKKDPSSEFPSFSDMKNMSKEELLEQQQRQSWEAMMIQVVLTNMQILTEIVKKGTSIAAGVIQ